MTQIPEINKQDFKSAFTKFEGHWSKVWTEKQWHRAANPGEKGSEKPKFYCLDMFPYPSGSGLHVGHPLGYITTDIVSRFKRMKGFNVLHPMGWDAFGLPAEQYAIQTGIHPAITTKKNIETYKRQLASIGLSYDWSREINTSDPKYYGWTQWLFKRFVEKGLSYEAEVAVNWCPALGTVLANDEVIDGKSERGGHPVERKPMRQWMMNIRAYADKLLQGLDTLDWVDSTKEHQRHWIGKSEGATLRFKIEGSDDQIETFTTRADTLFGVTFIALAPEHPLVEKLSSAEKQREVAEYQKSASAKSDLQRTDLAKDKSGCNIGAFAIHPLTGKNIPIWISDYILMGYGTGAIMGVPGHDERDLEFAKKFHLPVISVIDENNHLIASGEFNGQDIKSAQRNIVLALQKNGAGEFTTTYKLRDWVFSRQRYWGEPIPVLHIQEGAEKGKFKLLADDQLPLELPGVENYQPSGSGESPLVTVEEWIKTKDINGALAMRESNTMPGSAGSSWYHLRYMDPHNEKEPWSLEAESYWGPVDLYMGGQEHAVGHLLYVRFWHRFFYDLGLCSHPEPFKRLVHQGLILAEDGEKMSKSRGNVINPDHVIAQYGADTFRLFEMFLGPIEKTKPWQTANIEGVYRFLCKFWRLATNDSEGLSHDVRDIPESEWPESLVSLQHKTIRDVGRDIENLRMNTAVSALMILLNEASTFHVTEGRIPKQFIHNFTLMLAPFAPFTAEEIWFRLGHPHSLTETAWPEFDEAKTQSSQMEIAIQINGKVRDRIWVETGIEEEALKKMAIARENVQKWLEGKTPKKMIYVKGKLVSVVV